MISRRGLLVAVLFCLLVPPLPACTLVQVNLGPSREPLEESVVMGRGSAKVVLLEVSGVLLEDDPGQGVTPWSGRPGLLDRLAEELSLAEKDEAVKALLVKIDSPGGTVSASDMIYHQLVAHRDKTGHKIVVCLMGLAASGGYYAALAGDRILALPTATTGSIGVISLKLNLAGLMERYGIQAETVKSGPHKDMWSLFRPAGEDEQKLMQSLVDDFFGRFKSLVREKRTGMSEEQLETAFDGRIMSADRALELGLIDGLAYPEEAYAAAKELAGVEEAKLVAYHRPGARRSNIYAGAQAARTEPSGLPIPSPGPRLMYLWLPGAP